MPYRYPDSIPDYLKGLPAGAQKLGIRVFNSALKKTNDEDKARQACWGAIKQKYKKEGDKWVRKAKEDVDVDGANEGNELVEEVIELEVNLSEVEFDEEARTATATAITQGWSLNVTEGKQRYYSGQAIEDVAGLLSTSKKMFLGHKNTHREMNEWVATCLESWVVEENGEKKAKMKLEFTENPDTIWIYAEARKRPEEIGLSINGRGMIKTGKIGGKPASIVESIKMLRSVDFVTQPAARGMIDLAADKQFEIINEAINTLDNIIKKYEDSERPFEDFERVMRALRSFLIDMIYFSELEPDNFPAEIDKALDTFGGRMKEIIPAAHSVYASADDVVDAGYNSGDFVWLEDTWEATTKTEGGKAYPASAYLVVPDGQKPSTWKLRYKNFVGGKLQPDRSQMGKAAAALFKTFRGNKVQLPAAQRKSAISKLRGAYRKLGVPKEEWPDGLKETKETNMDKLAKFKEENPDLYAEIEDAITLLAKDRASKEVAEQIKTLVDEKTALEEQVASLTEEGKTQKEKLDEFEEEKKKADHKELIHKKLKEAEIDGDISENFVSILEEEESEEKIDMLIEDKKADLKKKEGVINDNPNPKPKEKKEEVMTTEERRKQFLS